MGAGTNGAVSAAIKAAAASGAARAAGALLAHPHIIPDMFQIPPSNSQFQH